MTIEKIVLSAEKADCRSGCPTCATHLESENLKHALTRLAGVSKVSVDEVTGKVSVEYETQKISVSKITERLERLGYRVQDASGGIR
jgi:copper chaperone CopZ